MNQAEMDDTTGSPAGNHRTPPRRLGRVKQLNGQSHPDIVQAFNDAVDELPPPSPFSNTKNYQVLNALVVWFLGLSPEDRRRASAEMMGRLGAYLEGEPLPTVRLPWPDEQRTAQPT